MLLKMVIDLCMLEELLPPLVVVGVDVEVVVGVEVVVVVVIIIVDDGRGGVVVDDDDDLLSSR